MFLFLLKKNSFKGNYSTVMGDSSSPKIQPAFGTPFMDYRGVTKTIRLPIFLEDFPGVTTEVDLLVGLEVSASRFWSPVFFFSSWCSSGSSVEALEPSTFACCISAVIGFLPCRTGGRQLCRCSSNLKKLAISLGDKACIRLKTSTEDLAP